jgi:hypothetical protein
MTTMTMIEDTLPRRAAPTLTPSTHCNSVRRIHILTNWYCIYLGKLNTTMDLCCCSPSEEAYIGWTTKLARRSHLGSKFNSLSRKSVRDTPRRGFLIFFHSWITLSSLDDSIACKKLT